ncbi:MAG: solute carrier organic anion transporter [Bacteroidales bacterium]|nr:solute carrier organic anion transporter [Bacteroidales bacterium]
MKTHSMLTSILFLFVLCMIGCTESMVIEESDPIQTHNEPVETKSYCNCSSHEHDDNCSFTNTYCPTCGKELCSAILPESPENSFCGCNVVGHSHGTSCSAVGTLCPNCGKKTCRNVWGGDGGPYVSYPTSIRNIIQSSNNKTDNFYFEGVLNAYKKLTVYINPGNHWRQSKRTYGIEVSVYPCGVDCNPVHKPHSYWLSNGQENWQHLYLNQVSPSSLTIYGIPVLTVNLRGLLSETYEADIYNKNIIDVFYHIQEVYDEYDEIITVVIDK